MKELGQAAGVIVFGSISKGAILGSLPESLDLKLFEKTMLVVHRKFGYFFLASPLLKCVVRVFEPPPYGDAARAPNLCL